MNTNVNNAPPTKKVLGVDIRYFFVYLAFFFFISIPGNFLASIFRLILPDITPTREGGFSLAYSVTYPLSFLSFLIITTVGLIIMTKLLEEKRAYMFRGEVSKKAILLEQLIPSAIIFLISIISLLRSGSVQEAPADLGAFICYLTGVIGPETPPAEVFHTDINTLTYVNSYTYWLIPLCNLFIYSVWNAAVYFIRIKATKKGSDKRSAETAELYQENLSKQR